MIENQKIKFATEIAKIVMKEPKMQLLLFVVLQMLQVQPN